MLYTLARKLTASCTKSLDDSILEHKEIYCHFEYPGIENVVVDPPEAEPEFCDLRFVKLNGKCWAKTKNKGGIRQHFMFR